MVEPMTWDGTSYCTDCGCRPAEYERPFAMIDGTIIVELICHHCYTLEHHEARRG
jgi:hypothetical protein